MREETSAARRKKIKTGISLLFACINITLVEKTGRFFKELAVAMERSAFFDSAEKGFLVFAVLWFAGAFVFYMLIRRLLCQPDVRLLRHALLWGVPMAVAYVMGGRLAADQTVFGDAESILESLAAAACLSVAAASCIAPVLQCKIRVKFSGEKRISSGKIWLFYSAVIFLCWLPVFLAYYPSIFAYDAEGQLYQVIAEDYSTHHPLLHTLFLGAFFWLGGAFGSYSSGMAVHSVVQMLLMAGAFGRALSYLYEKRIPKWQRILLLFFYALFPANSVLSVSTTKDVLFSALVLLYTIMLERMLCGRKWTGKDTVEYVILTVLLLLFRNNALYAFVVSVPLVYVGCRKWHVLEEDGRKSGAKRYLLVSAAAFLLFVVCNIGLRTAVHAQSGSPREMLSVPLQQMARVRVVKEAQLEPSLRQELEKYISSEWVFAAYDPHLADPVKNRAVIHDNPAGLIRTWMSLGMQYPGVYIDAFLDNSVGYWYLEDVSHAQVYGIGRESGFGYLSTDNRVMPAGCEIVPGSFLPGFRAFMERIVSDNVYQQIPVLRLIFAPAFYWWLLCLYAAVAVYRKKYIFLLPIVFLAAYYFTLLLSPTVLIRYAYPFVVTVPVMLSCLLVEEDENTQ